MFRSLCGPGNLLGGQPEITDPGIGVLDLALLDRELHSNVRAGGAFPRVPMILGRQPE